MLPRLRRGSCCGRGIASSVAPAEENHEANFEISAQAWSGADLLVVCDPLENRATAVGFARSHLLEVLCTTPGGQLCCWRNALVNSHEVMDEALLTRHTKDSTLGRGRGSNTSSVMTVAELPVVVLKINNIPIRQTASTHTAAASRLRRHRKFHRQCDGLCGGHRRYQWENRASSTSSR